MFLPQTRNIINPKGKIDINYLGRFENLEQDFQTILKKIGIKNIIHEVEKQLNRREHKPFYEYYDQEALNKANAVLYEDFKLLPFKKFNKIEDFMNEYNKPDVITTINDLVNSSSLLNMDLDVDLDKISKLNNDINNKNYLEMKTFEEETLEENTSDSETSVEDIIIDDFVVNNQSLIEAKIDDTHETCMKYF